MNLPEPEIGERRVGTGKIVANGPGEPTEDAEVEDVGVVENLPGAADEVELPGGKDEVPAHERSVADDEGTGDLIGSIEPDALEREVGDHAALEGGEEVEVAADELEAGGLDGAAEPRLPDSKRDLPGPVKETGVELVSEAPTKAVVDPRVVSKVPLSTPLMLWKLSGPR